MRTKRILTFFVTLMCGYILFAQEQHPENCPLGGVEDCQGQCGNFTDENSDGFCDFAILSKQNKNTKQQSIINTDSTKNATKSTTKTTKTPRVTNQKDNITKEPAQEQIESSQEQSVQQQTEIIEENTPSITPKKTNNKGISYHFWQILICTLVVYIVSVVIVRKKIIKKTTQRRFWNVILGITCLVSCLIGIYIVLARMYGWSMNFRTLMLYHVDFGVCMTIIAIIHILWHMTYWKNLFKVANKK